MVSLVRTRAGPFGLANAKDPRDVTIEDMLPVTAALPNTPTLVLSSDALIQLYQGKTIEMNQADNSYFLEDEEGALRALGKLQDRLLKLELNLTEA
jgi:tRNA U55 pseudouridine synthase TruB